jgi:hypothetical protein
MTPDTNTQLIMDRIDMCIDAELERLESIIELLQDIRKDKRRFTYPPARTHSVAATKRGI